jgi:hypothetical protein
MDTYSNKKNTDDLDDMDIEPIIIYDVISDTESYATLAEEE